MCRARRRTTRRCRCSTRSSAAAFTSRLNTNLREEHGYSYGAFSGFEERISPGAFSARAGVQTDKTAEALKEFFNEFTGILKPIPGEELDKAKNYVALGFPAEFETTGDLAQKMEEQVVHSLPDEYFPSYIRSVVQVTGPGVEKAAASYIQPDKFAVVIVGDRKVIEAGIRALNLGPVESTERRAGAGADELINEWITTERGLRGLHRNEESRRLRAITRSGFVNRGSLSIARTVSSWFRSILRGYG